MGSPVFPSNPLPFCRVLRPRRDLHAKPLRRFGTVGVYLYIADSRVTVISEFNRTAYRLAVYASCRRHRRLRNTRSRVVANLSRVAIPDDGTHSVDFLAFCASFDYGLFTARTDLTLSGPPPVP